MIRRDQTEYITFEKETGRFIFLPTGDIFEFTYEDFLINGYWGNCKDGSANNIYLRIYDQGRISAYPLLGRQSQSEIHAGQNQLMFTGKADDVAYQVTFLPAEGGIWFWKVDLHAENRTVDLLYGQDVGVASKGAVLTNELYMSQYLDHKVMKGDSGYTVSSRQNQLQGGRNPYLQQGCMNTEIIGFSTDGTQFFGNDYRKTHVPKALDGNLPNENYQFELAYIGLQTSKMKLHGKRSVVFYGIFKPDQPQAVTELLYQQELKDAYNKVQAVSEPLWAVDKPVLKTEFGAPYSSEEFSEEEVNRFFPDKKLVEREGTQTLSFFTPEHTHVVLQQKEVLMERPHGHILCTRFDGNEVPLGLVTSTNYMYGIFHSQLVAGNTSMNKLLSTARGFLNIMKNSGQRIYLKLDGVYRILTMPAVYVMGISFSRWYYKVEEDVLIVTAFALSDRPALALQVSSQMGRKYDYLITNQLIMGEHEYTHPVNVLHTGNVIRVTKVESGPFDPYPELNYAIHVIGSDYRIGDDRVFYGDEKSRDESLLTIDIQASADFQLIVEGRLDAQETDVQDIEPNRQDLIEKRDPETEQEDYASFYKSFLGHFRLRTEENSLVEIEKLNEIIWWYTHDALIHFAVPHGLEQPGGAAWGTRDVCQGPLEFFLATGHFELMRNVLLKLFEHQYLETKEWPQWFMFDKYDIHAEEWHGDVVFWPLKSIGDYLAATNDTSILEERLAYRYLSNHKATDEKSILLEHVKQAVETIRNRFIGSAALVNYAGGDWDDTLQPADPKMKKGLVSAWTVALSYQVLKQLAAVLEIVDGEYAADLEGLCSEIKKSFHDILIKDGVIAGFAYFKEDNTIDYMLHPLDQTTGIHYRLLPLTRSIIADLVDEAQAAVNVDIINQHLTFPDGVRLMDRPAQYAGGVSRYFQRAEQAANVGREISLQYVHAHIRYIEAMAKLGQTERAWEALFQIHPIQIKDAVPNAALRQANAYFSSSEGAFLDRYDYQEHFDKLRDGTIQAKGGWRIYSSGPGIFIRQVVSNLLGIRFAADSLIIDPVLPKQLDGIRFDFTYRGSAVTFVYHLGGSNGEIKVISDGQELPAEKLANPYRAGGIRIDHEVIQRALKHQPELHVYLV